VNYPVHEEPWAIALAISTATTSSIRLWANLGNQRRFDDARQVRRRFAAR
jgi:hypothetical protein